MISFLGNRFSGTAPAPTPSLLLHFGEANGATSIADSSPYARTLTGNTNCKVSSAQSKFAGYNSLHLTQRDSGGLQIASHANFARTLNQPWWLDFWIYYVATENFSGSPNLVRWDLTTASANDQIVNTGNSAKIKYENDGFGAEETFGVAYSANTWVHFGLGYDGSTITRWKNGASDYTLTVGRPASTAGAIYIGGTNAGSVGASDATDIYLAEVRLVIGTCVHTAPFTPPAAPY